jgi:RNA processing factor Prp31
MLKVFHPAQVIARCRAIQMRTKRSPKLVTGEPSASMETKANESSVERIVRLEQQLRKLKQERDTLKKAIQILMRAN